MKNFTFRTFLLHLAITLAYTGPGYYLYYSGSITNTVAMGLFFMLFTVAHLGLTILICATPLAKARPLQPVVVKLLINAGAVVFWTCVHMIVDYTASI
jgi:hypothetical protein